jgi:hypothetical protein
MKENRGIKIDNVGRTDKPLLLRGDLINEIVNLTSAVVTASVEEQSPQSPKC